MNKINLIIGFICLFGALAQFRLGNNKLGWVNLVLAVINVCLT